VHARRTQIPNTRVQERQASQGPALPAGRSASPPPSSVPLSGPELNFSVHPQHTPHKPSGPASASATKQPRPRRQCDAAAVQRERVGVRRRAHTRMQTVVCTARYGVLTECQIMRPEPVSQPRYPLCSLVIADGFTLAVLVVGNGPTVGTQLLCPSLITRGPRMLSLSPSPRVHERQRGRAGGHQIPTDNNNGVRGALLKFQLLLMPTPAAGDP
jgi:hypothetical protein